MATTDAVPARVLAKTREICLGLPDTKETMTWGKPHFRVGEKIFAGCGEENGKPVIGFKLEMEHAAAIIRDPRFWRAPYVGHKGWVSMDAGSVKNWDEVQAMIIESFCLIAPKRTVAKLDEWAVASPAKKATRKRARATKSGEGEGEGESDEENVAQDDEAAVSKVGVKETVGEKVALTRGT